MTELDQSPNWEDIAFTVSHEKRDSPLQDSHRDDDMLFTKINHSNHENTNMSVRHEHGNRERMYKAWKESTSIPINHDT